MIGRAALAAVIATSSIVTAEPSPRPGEASGITHPRPVEKSSLSPVLAGPRAVVSFLLSGPEWLAAEIDDYLEARGPNSTARGSESGWSVGVMGRWETALGPTTGASVGYRFDDSLGADAAIALLGRNGQTAITQLHLGSYGSLKVRPRLSLLAGRDRDRVFAGIGAADCGQVAPLPATCAGPRRTYDQDQVVASATTTAEIGRFELLAGARFETSETEDGGDSPVSEVFDTAALAGFDHTDVAVGFTAGVVFDSRRPAFAWLSPAAPSSGTRARAELEVIRGGYAEMDYSAAFIDLEVVQLFNLFRGNRVLSIGARGRALAADSGELPFFRLPTLGGADSLRFLADGELRDRTVASGELRYEWAVGHRALLSVFAEGGAIGPTLDELETSTGLYGGGARLRFVNETGDRLALMGAVSAEGAFGFAVELGGL